jgi:hypothetical protein
MAHKVTNDKRIAALNAAVAAFNTMGDQTKESDNPDKALHTIMNAYLDVINDDKEAEKMLLDDTKPSIHYLFTVLGHPLPKFTNGFDSNNREKFLQLIENHLYNNYQKDVNKKKSLDYKTFGGRRRPRKSTKRTTRRRPRRKSTKRLRRRRRRTLRK